GTSSSLSRCANSAVGFSTDNICHRAWRRLRPSEPKVSAADRRISSGLLNPVRRTKSVKDVNRCWPRTWAIMRPVASGNPLIKRNPSRSAQPPMPCIDFPEPRTEELVPLTRTDSSEVRAKVDSPPELAVDSELLLISSSVQSQSL